MNEQEKTITDQMMEIYETAEKQIQEHQQAIERLQQEQKGAKAYLTALKLIKKPEYTGKPRGRKKQED